jgi:hypothetical protein
MSVNGPAGAIDLARRQMPVTEVTFYPVAGVTFEQPCALGPEFTCQLRINLPAHARAIVIPFDTQHLRMARDNINAVLDALDQGAGVTKK